MATKSLTLADRAFALLTKDNRPMDTLTLAAHLNRDVPEKNRAASSEVYREMANDSRFTEHRSQALTTFTVAK